MNGNFNNAGLEEALRQSIQEAETPEEFSSVFQKPPPGLVMTKRDPGAYENIIRALRARIFGSPEETRGLPMPAEGVPPQPATGPRF